MSSPMPEPSTVPAYTPGPWQACSCGKCGLVWAIPADAVVATVTREGEGGEKWNLETWQANMRLIEAAPQLVAALEEFVDWADNCENLFTAARGTADPDAELEKDEGWRSLVGMARTALDAVRGLSNDT